MPSVRACVCDCLVRCASGLRFARATASECIEGIICTQTARDTRATAAAAVRCGLNNRYTTLHTDPHIHSRTRRPHIGDCRRWRRLTFKAAAPAISTVQLTNAIVCECECLCGVVIV